MKPQTCDRCPLTPVYLTRIRNMSGQEYNLCEKCIEKQSEAALQERQKIDVSKFRPRFLKA